MRLLQIWENLRDETSWKKLTSLIKKLRVFTLHTYFTPKIVLKSKYQQKKFSTGEYQGDLWDGQKL